MAVSKADFDNLKKEFDELKDKQIIKKNYPQNLLKYTSSQMEVLLIMPLHY